MHLRQRGRGPRSQHGAEPCRDAVGEDGEDAGGRDRNCGDSALISIEAEVVGYFR